MSYQLRKARRQARREGLEPVEPQPAPPPRRRLPMAGLGRLFVVIVAAAAAYVVLAGR